MAERLPFPSGGRCWFDSFRLHQFLADCLLRAYPPARARHECAQHRGLDGLAGDATPAADPGKRHRRARGTTAAPRSGRLTLKRSPHSPSRRQKQRAHPHTIVHGCVIVRPDGPACADRPTACIESTRAQRRPIMTPRSPASCARSAIRSFAAFRAIRRTYTGYPRVVTDESTDPFLTRRTTPNL